MDRLGALEEAEITKVMLWVELELRTKDLLVVMVPGSQAAFMHRAAAAVLDKLERLEP
jgi:hypothetical protein